MLTDIVGGEPGAVCHPVAMVKPSKKGLFSFKPNHRSAYRAVSESKLRLMIERGDFDRSGSVRMVSPSAKSSACAPALRVRSYKGKRLPLGR